MRSIDDALASLAEHGAKLNTLRAEIIRTKAEITNTQTECFREEIYRLIAKHNEHDKEPPFSPSEMVVMAGVCSSEPSLSIQDCLEWIISTFGYYRDQALSSYAEAMWNDIGVIVRSNPIKHFGKGFDDWRAPLQRTNHASVMVLYTKNDMSDQFEVNAAQARIYLRRWLEPERQGHFRFLNLPAELRNRIYAMVFAMPASGVCIHPDETRLVEREIDIVIGSDDRDPWADTQVETIKGPPLAELLALLRVNKQIYQEAMPYFFEINRFCARTIHEVSFLLCDLVPARLACLNSVYMHSGHDRHRTFRYADGSDIINFNRAVHKLGEHSQLEKLEVVLDDNSWFNLPIALRKAYGRTSKFTKAQQLPWIHDLVRAAAKAETFVINGDCPMIRAYLENEVKKAKEGVLLPPKANVRKRKVAQQDGAQSRAVNKARK